MAEISTTIIKNKKTIRKYIHFSSVILIIYKYNNKVYTKKTSITYLDETKIEFSNPFFNDNIIIDEHEKMLLRVYPFDCFYIEFKSSIIDIDPIQLKISAAFPKEINKIQRRDSFRVPVSIKGLMKTDRVISEESNCQLLDISIGGALLATNESYLEQMQKGLLEFTLKDNNKKFVLKIEIRRLKKIESQKSKYKHHCGVKFTDMKPADLQLISHFITRVQLKEKAEHEE